MTLVPLSHYSELLVGNDVLNQEVRSLTKGADEVVFLNQGFLEALEAAGRGTTRGH